MLDLGIERSNPDYYAVTRDERGLRRRIFLAAVQQAALRQRAWPMTWAAAWALAGIIPALPISRCRPRAPARSTAFRGWTSEIDDLLKNPATPAELKRAKDNILNSFIFRFDTPEKVLREKMAYEFYHYPLDFLERYRTEVEKVTV